MNGYLTFLPILGTGVLSLSKGKIAAEIPIFRRYFQLFFKTPILPFERIKFTVCLAGENATVNFNIIIRLRLLRALTGFFTGTER